ncbi:GntR family transcriptional regulator [Caballeronia arvi]|uniref:GntR family transcriptional regulator n=1 Tax=Caballeronia arvi TaxID=1777135 RepID=A0A158KII5_9BURK|nr:GntR family transcriptional regulator [Caballeronia arvi]
MRDQVYQLLREDLLSGTLAAGTRLVELDLAQRYGVSRTPVREALFQLAREGLVAQTDRGYALMADTPLDFVQRMGVRLLLDPSLAAHAARNGTDQQIEELRLTYKKLTKAAETAKFVPFVTALHQFRTLLLEMSHNTALSRVCAVLEDQFLLVRNEYFKKDENRKTAIEHNGLLLKAIETRDAKAATRVAKEYIELLIATDPSGSRNAQTKPTV